jgi:proteasome lid subunit RPN8/RPN11
VTRTLVIGEELLEAIRAAARRAYPSECCGLIEGAASEDGWRASAVHSAANLAEEPSRHFLIDPDVQFRLMRSLRGTGRDIIGCFHSHPGGDAEPSQRDREGAGESGFLWLIVGAREGEEPEVAAFVFDARANRFEPVTLSQTG